MTGDRKIRPVTPGEVLADVLEDIELSVADFAALTDIPIDELMAIIDNKKPIAQDTALAIGNTLTTSSQLWLALQAKVDNWVERHGS